MRRSRGRIALLGLAYLALLYHGLAFWFTARGAEPLAPIALNMAVIVVAIAFLHHIDPSHASGSGRCPACGNQLSPTRSVGGRRLWSCPGCGLERARQRPFEAAWADFAARRT